MKLIPILAAAAAATLAIPAANAAASAPAPAAASAPVKAEFQRHGHHRRAYWRTVCTTKVRHHRRIRTCRKVRYWR